MTEFPAPHLMRRMRVLFIGGTGIISSACSALAAGRGMELDLLVRGESTNLRPPPKEARLISADIRRPEEVQAALASKTYDAVVDFVAFTPEHIETDLKLFRDKTKQFVFISSASAYHKPVRRLPITESTPLHNPFWKYSRDKIACEQRLLRSYEEYGFPVTIVRPSHTYDRTLLPFSPHGCTVLARLLADEPVVIHGDGTSLWTLTHHRDFAVGLVGLLGHPGAIGESFHITSDEVITWNEIYETVAAAVGKQLRPVYVPSKVIAQKDQDWGAGLLGDKAHSVIFDNTKLRRLVPEFRAVLPFHAGAKEIATFYQDSPERIVRDSRVDRLFDELIAQFGA